MVDHLHKHPSHYIFANLVRHPVFSNTAPSSLEVCGHSDEVSPGTGVGEEADSTRPLSISLSIAL